MRINVYAEELTYETEHVSKKMPDGRTFFAIRLFLKSANELHHSIKDDDRSAITLWVPWTKESGHNFEMLCVVTCALHDAARSLAEMAKSGKLT